MLNAADNGTNNQWDNGTIGNYWADYIGVDTNDDGIGDTPYNIQGSAGSQDNYPIWWDRLVISIGSPSTNDICDNGPSFYFSIHEGIANTMWYTLDEGLTNITFTGSIGSIDQTEWNKRVDGPVIIKFFANDSKGFLSFTEVTVLKESIPQITINTPTFSEMFGFNAPEFNITVNDLSPINATWYTIDGGLTNYTFSGLSGFINQLGWGQKEDGVLTIRFYANDSFGNLGFEDVNVTKDTTASKITINTPIPNQLCGVDAPTFFLTIVESNLLEKRYSLNGRPNITFTSETQFSQSEWDNVGNGAVIIIFYIIDKAGNINSSEVIVRKDVNAPVIAINNPQNNDVIGATAPNFDISIDELNLEKTWYSLNGGNNITFTGLTGTINQALWDALSEGNVIIKFYANDTLGRIGFQEVTIVKTIPQPSPPEIPGYNILLLLGILSIVAVIIAKKRLNHFN